MLITMESEATQVVRSTPLQNNTPNSEPDNMDVENAERKEAFHSSPTSVPRFADSTITRTPLSKDEEAASSSLGALQNSFINTSAEDEMTNGNNKR
jgi:hypothetical protein